MHLNDLLYIVRIVTFFGYTGHLMPSAREYREGEYRLVVTEEGDWELQCDGPLGALEADDQELFDGASFEEVVDALDEWIQNELLAHAPALRALLLEVAGQEGR
jgi:hypothetical protein